MWQIFNMGSRRAGHGYPIACSVSMVMQEVWGVDNDTSRDSATPAGDVLKQVAEALDGLDADQPPEAEEIVRLRSLCVDAATKVEVQNHAASYRSALKALDTRNVGHARIVQMLTGRSILDVRSSEQPPSQPTCKFSRPLPKVLQPACLQFDAFSYDRESAYRPLSRLAYTIIDNEGLIDSLHLHAEKLKQFLTRIEAGYLNIPYHNRIHACDVLHRSHAILQSCDPYTFSLEDRLACYIAAAVHDYQHTGVSSSFLIASRHPLARLYNDKSPWENHHASTALEVLFEVNFMADCSPQQQEHIRKCIIQLVLATDMMHHFDWMDRLTNAARMMEPGESQEVRLLSMCLVMKCADVGHSTCVRAVHAQWVTALQEELFCQGDLERSMNLPLSPMADRTSAKDHDASQIAFFSVIVIPLFTLLVKWFPGAAPLLIAAEDNLKSYSEA